MPKKYRFPLRSVEIANFTDTVTVELDAGSFGPLVKRDNGAAAEDLQPRWMNKIRCEESVGVNTAHMDTEVDTNSITL